MICNILYQRAAHEAIGAQKYGYTYNEHLKGHTALRGA